MTSLFAVSGKTAVVTGGSRGLGAMIARGLVEAGAQVIISSRKADNCEATAKELNDLGPGKCIPVAADLGTSDGVARLGDRVAELAPRLDLLVNNAGATWGAPLEVFPGAAFDKVFNLNVKSVFSLTQRLLPQLRAAASPQDPARIINIGSVDGLAVSISENFSYGASKAAVHMLTRKLAAELASEHITVNAIAPGPFPTQMTAHFLDDPAHHHQATELIPLRRVGKADDIVGATIFLASRAGAYLTGVVLPVDGGATGAN